jgi:hypothetical protein
VDNVVNSNCSEQFLRGEIHMSINAAIDNKCEQQEIKEAYQTAMDGFEEAPVLNEEIRLR